MLVLRGLEGDPVVKVAPLPSAETLYACACTSLNPQGTPLGPGNQLHLCCQSNNRPGVQLCCQPANLLYPVDTSSDSPSSPVTSISIVPDSTRRRRRRPRPPNAVATAAPSANHTRLTCPSILHHQYYHDQDDDDKNIIPHYTEHPIVHASIRLQYKYQLPPLIPRTAFHSSLSTPGTSIHSYIGRFE